MIKAPMIRTPMIKTIVTGVAVAVLVTACGGRQEPGQAAPAGGNPQGGTAAPGSGTTAPTSAPPGSQPPATTDSPAPARCTAAGLNGVIQIGDPAAGNRYARLVVTNTGSAPCTLYGYGGFQLVDAGGKALPTRTLRDEPPGPSLVRLAPGAKATKNLHWGVVSTGSEPADKPCQPEPHTARIIPPDETEPFTVEWKYGPVCAAGTFHDSAYYAP